MDPGAGPVCDPAERFLYLFAEYPTGGIEWNSGQWD